MNTYWAYYQLKYPITTLQITHLLFGFWCWIKDLKPQDIYRCIFNNYKCTSFTLTSWLSHLVNDIIAIIIVIMSDTFFLTFIIIIMDYFCWMVRCLDLMMRKAYSWVVSLVAIFHPSLPKIIICIAVLGSVQ